MGGFGGSAGPLENLHVVTGQTTDPDANAIFGRNDANTGSTAADGGVHGAGVFGLTFSPGGPGVFGANNSGKTGAGVIGRGPTGVQAFGDIEHGLDVFSNKDIAIFAQGGTFSGVFNGALVVNKSPSLNPDPNNPAKPIDGSIVINDGNLFVNKGDVILGNADCAEDFSVSEGLRVEPGTVMILTGEEELCESSTPYDKRVAGVVSGASTYKPGLVLDRQPGQEGRVPLALMGKVYCKVDAQYGQVDIGDLLTTSPTPGHAMKASDPARAFGAVIGKALRPLEVGQGLVPILVALQ